MISCQTFRSTLEPGTHDAEVLEHLRSCDACLDFAVEIDPDNFFRLLGCDDMVPPGGRRFSPPMERKNMSGSTCTANSRQASQRRT